MINFCKTKTWIKYKNVNNQFWLSIPFDKICKTTINFTWIYATYMINFEEEYDEFQTET